MQHEHFFISAPICEELESGVWDRGGLFEADEKLYLRFASSGGSPDDILALANSFGFLNPDRSRQQSVDWLWSGYEKTDPPILFRAESVVDWLDTMGALSALIRKWADLEKKPSARRTNLLNWYNDRAQGSLGFRAEVDPTCDKVEFGVVASSLSGLLFSQFAQSMAIGVRHIKCCECTTLFAVHPHHSRDGKKYCSDACRMRAYRKRKTTVT